MDIALPALLVVIGLLPGIVCFSAYYSGRFPRRLAGLSSVSELALYVCLATPIWLFWEAICPSGCSVNYELVAKVATQAPDATTRLIAHFREYELVTLTSYVNILLLSALLGAGARRLVWVFRLDTKWPALQLKESWYYSLQGRIPGLPRSVLPIADILTSHQNGLKLYRGLVVSFEAASDGSIRSITLEQASRGTGRDTEFKWKPIPGGRFIILGQTIGSINMSYVELLNVEVMSLRAKFTYYARVFLWEEP